MSCDFIFLRRKNAHRNECYAKCQYIVPLFTRSVRVLECYVPVSMDCLDVQEAGRNVPLHFYREKRGEEGEEKNAGIKNKKERGHSREKMKYN